MSAEFELPGVDLERAVVDHVDDVFLMALPSYSRMLEENKKTPNDLPGLIKGKKQIALVGRIRAFSTKVFPGDDLNEIHPRARAFAIGVVFARSACILHWVRNEQPYKKQALDFAIGEAVNLEGDLAVASNVEAAVNAHVSERFTNPYDCYDQKFPKGVSVATEGSNYPAFVLGSALALTEAQEVESLKITAQDGVRAGIEMTDALNDIGTR